MGPWEQSSSLGRSPSSLPTLSAALSICPCAGGHLPPLPAALAAPGLQRGLFLAAGWAPAPSVLPVMTPHVCPQQITSVKFSVPDLGTKAPGKSLSSGLTSSLAVRSALSCKALPPFHFRVLLVGSVCEPSQKGTSALDFPSLLLLQVGVSSSATTSWLSVIRARGGGHGKAVGRGKRRYSLALGKRGSVQSCVSRVLSSPRPRPGARVIGVRPQRDGLADAQARTPGGHPAW